MPPELWEEIACLLCDCDIRNLRLTCHPLAIWFCSPIRNPCVLLSVETAMAKLKELSAHNIFARQIKSISFSNKILKHGLPRLATCVQRENMSSRPSRSERVNMRDNQRTCEELKTRERAFRGAPLTACLTEVFNNLKKANGTHAAPTIRFLPDRHIENVWGHRRLQQLVGFGKWLAIWGVGPEAYCAFWEALIHTDFTIHDLQLGDKHCSIPIRIFDLPRPVCFVERLHSLQLVFSTPTDSQPEDSHHLTCFMQFLAQATKLERICLVMNHPRLGS